ncbi:hypothetical protein WJX82_001365 [Trebouxia sp. C0006]
MPYTVAGIASGHSGHRVLYVLECEGSAEWQPVPAENPVVSWVQHMKDRLTMHSGNPEGEDLTIPLWWVHPAVHPDLEPLQGTEHMDHRGGISLYNIVQAQLLADATSIWVPKYLLILYQMTMADDGPAVEDLYVTASKSFWQAVEATADTGRFVFKANMSAQEQGVPSIEGYAILLPTILSVMYGQGEWPEDSVSEFYGDHSAWDRKEILEMLDKFLSVTHAITLPDLEEYNWRSNKEALYDVFQKYYEQDPSTHVAPIPTAQIELPVEQKFHRNVCYSQRYTGTAVIPELEIRATAAAILSAAIKLDSNTDATAIQKHNPDIGNGTLRKYVLKRNHSGFARKVVQITLNLTNWQSGTFYSGLHSDQNVSAVERMLRESCGEDWLLQPFIPDMGSNEYRVNLIGGGQAKGSPRDAAVVFTPAKAADNQLYMYNLTLPHGFFSRAPIGATDLFKTLGTVNQYNSTGEKEYTDKYFPYLVWKEPAMHQMLVDVALGGAQAFLQSRRPSSMSERVLLRIDIALTQHGNVVRPFINEAHYYADATIMFPVWPPEQQSVYTSNNSDTPLLYKGGTQPRTVTGWGLWLAQALWKEVQLRSAQHDSAPESTHGPLPILAHSLKEITP